MQLNIQTPPTYPQDFEVLFCGEAPGEEEVRLKEGFVGKAGGLLQKVVYASGLQWSTIAKTNVVKRAPDGGYDSDHFQTTFYEKIQEGRKKKTIRSVELEEWIKLLRDEINEHKPKVIVACGAEAMQALTGCYGITKHRGSILNCCLVPGIPVVPIIHPSAILRSANWQELYISSEIIRKKVIGLLLSKEEWTKPWIETLAPSLEDWFDYVKNVNSDFTLDIETRAGSIASFALCYNDGKTDRAICIPIQTTRGPYWPTEEDEYEVWFGLQHLLDKYPVVLHNAFYDLDWLADYDIKPKVVQDTMLLFHRFYPELPKSLAFVNMFLGDIPYYKDDGSTWGFAQPDEKLWSYNIKDAVSTLRVYMVLCELGKADFNHESRLYRDYTIPLLPIAFEMQQLGMVAEPSEIKFARNTLEDELKKVRFKLETLSNGALVVKPGNKKITDKQIMMHLYGELNLSPIKNRKTKKMTADEDALVELLLKNPKLEVLQAINAERKFIKALNSYIDIDWKKD